MKIKRHAYQTNIDHYCDSKRELGRVHPEHIDYKRLDHFLSVYLNQGFSWNPFRQIFALGGKNCGFGNGHFCWWLPYGNLYNMKHTSVFLHWSTSYFYYYDLCVRNGTFNFNDPFELQKCAVAYTLNKEWDSHDGLVDSWVNLYTIDPLLNGTVVFDDKVEHYWWDA